MQLLNTSVTFGLSWSLYCHTPSLLSLSHLLTCSRVWPTFPSTLTSDTHTRETQTIILSHHPTTILGIPMVTQCVVCTRRTQYSCRQIHIIAALILTYSTRNCQNIQTIGHRKLFLSEFWPSTCSRAAQKTPFSIESGCG